MTGSSDRSSRFLDLKASPALIFRLILAAVMLSTCFGISYATTHRAAILVAFPGTANGVVYAGLLAVGALGLVALAGLWAWRRWALFLYGILTLAGLVLDVLARAPALHQATMLSASALIFWLAWLNRKRFGSTAATGGSPTGAF